MVDPAQPAKQVTWPIVTYEIYKINRIDKIFLHFYKGGDVADDGFENVA
jgi:hypothetical protein